MARAALTAEATPTPIGSELFTEGRLRKVTSPFDGSVVGAVCHPTAPMIELALRRASEAVPQLAAMSAWERSERLSRIASRLDDQRDQLAELIVAEAGKPIRDARAEASRAVYVFRWAAEEAKRWGGEWTPLDTEQGFRRSGGLIRRFPVGPLLAITPFNFPLSLVAHKVAPALAVGNPVIIKPSERTPLTAIHLAHLLLEEDWPAGAISVLVLDGPDTANLAADASIRAVSFTGSEPVGWRLRSALPRKHMTLELGGNAAALVEPDADMAHAARRLCFGAFAYAGQVCISTQRVLVANERYDEFLEAFIDRVDELVCGDPSSEQTDVGPLISAEAAERVSEWVGEARAGGACVLAGGDGEPPMLAPTVLTEVRHSARCWSEEVFGPVAVIEPYRSFEEGIELANSTRFGLQAAVFTERLDRVMQAHERLECGAVIVNDAPFFRAVHMPYGGSKDSGAGREGVRWAMDAMSEPRLLALPLP